MALMNLFLIIYRINSETRFELELGDHKLLLSPNGIEDLFENTCDMSKHRIEDFVGFIARVSK